MGRWIAALLCAGLLTQCGDDEDPAGSAAGSDAGDVARDAAASAGTGGDRGKDPASFRDGGSRDSGADAAGGSPDIDAASDPDAGPSHDASSNADSGPDPNPDPDPDPGPDPDPNAPTVPYEPPSIEADARGIIHLLDPAAARVHRYDPATARYLEPIAIGTGAGVMTYSVANDRLYIAYSNGQVTVLDPGASAPAESAFTTLSQSVAASALVAAGPNLVAIRQGVRQSFAPDGQFLSMAYVNWTAARYAYSPVTARLYYDNGTLRCDELAVNGAFGAQSAAAFTSGPDGGPDGDGASYVSASGLVLTGLGHVFDGRTLAWRDRLLIHPSDALFLPDDTLLTLRDDGAGDGVLEQWSADFERENVQRLSGRALRVVDCAGAVIVIAMVDGSLTFTPYSVGDDGDGDGARYEDDDFPLDPAASLDTDHDGFPDAYNPGKGTADSSEGLDLDAFPFDAACQLSTHALAAGGCDLSVNLGPYEPKWIAVDAQDIVYMHDPWADVVRRYRLSAGSYLNPIPVAPGVVDMIYSPAHDRIYVAHDDGGIRVIDPDDTHPFERPFATTAFAPESIAAAGAYLVAAEGRAYVFTAGGGLVFMDATGLYGLGRLQPAGGGRIFMGGGQLSRFSIDPSSGALSARMYWPYSGTRYVADPVRPRADGQLVVFGSGDVHDGASLLRSDGIPIDFVDGWWDGAKFITIRRADADQLTPRTRVEQWRDARVLEDVRHVPGSPLHLLAASTGVHAVTSRGGFPAFTRLPLDGDGDEDGVTFAADAFPLDRAASLDTDHDGSPDAWNPGMGPADSTTKLGLDAFPSDAACQLAAHAIVGGTACDIAGRIPTYSPQRIEIDARGVIHLLDGAGLIRRYATATGKHLNPIVLAREQLPTAGLMTYSPDNDRLYVGYRSGVITAIDPAAPYPRERPFAVTRSLPRGLVAAGPFVFASDNASTTSENHTFDAAGKQISSVEPFNLNSTSYSFCPGSDRVYYVEDGSSSAHYLSYESIDPVTGELAGDGQSPYDSQHVIAGPTYPSADGSYVLVATGHVLHGTTLAYLASLPFAPRSALWLADNTLLTLRADAQETVLERWSPALSLQSSARFAGIPLLVIGTAGAMTVITQVAGKPAFTTVP